MLNPGALCRSQEFPRETEACVAVLHRCNDAELSIQELVARMFHSLWMCNGAALALHAESLNPYYVSTSEGLKPCVSCACTLSPYICIRAVLQLLLA